jgi:hypothetical protein
MLALNRSLLKREYVLMNVLKALASIISTCNLHVIFLSKITPSYFAIFKNNIFFPFSMRRDSGGRRLRKKWFPRVLSSFILIFQASHQGSIELRPRWSFLTMKPSLRSVAYRHESSAESASWTTRVREASLMYILHRVGKRTEPYGTPACISLRWHHAFCRNPTFSLRGKS